MCIVYVLTDGKAFESDDDGNVDIERVAATTGNVNRAAVIPERQVKIHFIASLIFCCCFVLSVGTGGIFHEVRLLELIELPHQLNIKKTHFYTISAFERLQDTFY